LGQHFALADRLPSPQAMHCVDGDGAGGVTVVGENFPEFPEFFSGMEIA